MMSTRYSDFLTPFIRIWNRIILKKSRNLPYYLRFSMTPSDEDIISGSPLMEKT